MTLLQKLSNWLFGTPPIPSSTVEKAPEPAPVPISAVPVIKEVPPVAEPITISVQPLPEPPKEVTLTLNHPSEWPFTEPVSTVTVTPDTKQRKPRQKKAAAPAPAVVAPNNKQRKPRQKKS